MDGPAAQAPGLAGGRVDIGVVPVGLGAGVALPQERGVVGAPDRFRHDGGDLHHVDVDRVVEQVRRRAVVQRQVVGQAAGLGRQVRVHVVQFVEGHAVEPVHHRLEVLLDDLRVPELVVELPGHLADGRAPGGAVGEGGVVGAVVGGHGRADAARDVAVVADALVGPQGHHPLAEEVAGVRLVEAGAHVGLGVARPAHALVALRAVGRQGQEVAQLAALDVAEQLVHALPGHAVGGRGVVGPGRNFGRGEHEAADVLHGQGPLVGRDVDLDVLVAAERVARPDRDGAGAVRDVEVRVERGAVGLVEDVARDAPAAAAEALHIFGLVALQAGVDLLAVGQGDDVARGQPARGDVDLGHADHVDAHVVDIGAGVVDRHHPACGQGLPHAHGLVVARHDVEVHPVARRHADGRRPGAVVEAGLAPARQGLARVVALALEETTQAHGTVLPGLPVFRGGDEGLAPPVLVGDDEPGEQGLPVAEEVEVAGREGHVARVPAAGELGAERVAPLAEQVRDVVFEVAHGLAVLAVARGEPVGADLPAVEIQAEGAHRSGVEPGGADLAGGGELAAEHGLGPVGRVGPGERRPADADALPVHLHAGKAPEQAVIRGVEDHVVLALARVQDPVVRVLHLRAVPAGKPHGAQVGEGRIIAAAADLADRDARGARGAAGHPHDERVVVAAAGGCCRHDGGAVDGEAQLAGLRLDLDAVPVSGREYAAQVALRAGFGVEDAQRLVRPVAREIPDPEDADLAPGRFDLDLEVTLFRGDAVAIEEGASQAKVVGAEDQRGAAALRDAEVRADAVDDLRGGVQLEGGAADPAGALPRRQARVHQTGLEARTLRVHRSGAVLDRHFPGVGHVRLERHAGVADVVRAAVRDFAAVP